MDNHQFCATWAKEQHSLNSRVLDYGCGAGQIVQKLRAFGIDAYGCDLFYGGGDSSPKIPPEVRDRIQRMTDQRIPFPDNSFDLVINNQVMEHVEDLGAVLTEINRVLKPGGRVLSLFPDRGVWREGHCGIPFLHWFPKHSSTRLYYAWICRAAGAGYHKENKSWWQWSKDFCKYLDDWTHYRSFADIRREYKRFFDITFIEPDWLDRRAPRIASSLPDFIKTVIVRKLGMLVFEAQKTALNSTAQEARGTTQSS
jgi:SAM-dependent methyltransferase